MGAILPNMPISNSDIFCWTDSTIVLAWLNKPTCHWTTFVANQVTKITQVTSTAHLTHVRSEHNSADLVKACRCGSWLEGPDWLQPSKDKGPTLGLAPPVTDLEQRTVKVNFAKALFVPKGTQQNHTQQFKQKPSWEQYQALTAGEKCLSAYYMSH